MARHAQEDAASDLRDAFTPSDAAATAATQGNPYAAYSGEALPGVNPDSPIQAEGFSQPIEDQPSGSPRELRDAFAPAQPDKADVSEPLSDIRKRPIQPGRVALVLLLLGMTLFCAFKGGDLISLLMNNDLEMKQAREEYKQSSGGDLYSDAHQVALLPAGQTYAPTQTPLSAQPTRMPSPTPVFTFNEAAMASLNNRGEDSQQPARTRLTDYPENPMRNVLPSVAALREENAEVVGHLVIEGLLDEVVAQRNNTFYLTHNYRGTSSEAGAVFADKDCAFFSPPENLLLRGQATVEGKVFAPLWQYVTGGIEFAGAHATARLTTPYEEGTYMLLSVIQASSNPNSPDYFDFSNHLTFSTDEAFFQYVQAAQAHSLYPVNLGVNAGDRLLTLATVGGDSCLVLIFKTV